MRGFENMKHNLDVRVVKKLMFDRRISQRDLARLLDVTEVAVSRYMSRERNPKTGTIKKMAEILGVAPEDILVLPENSVESETAYRKVIELISIYAGEWNHNERMRIADKLLF